MEYGAICTPFIFVVYAKSKYLCVLISNEMGKNKLEKFADMASYPHVFEYPYSAVDNVPFDMTYSTPGRAVPLMECTICSKVSSSCRPSPAFKKQR